MDEIVEHAWAISIVGDFLTLFGAFWTAHAVLLTPGQAAEIAFGRWDNEPLKNALLKQSGDARIGLVCVAGIGLPDCQQAHRRILFLSQLPRAHRQKNGAPTQGSLKTAHTTTKALPTKMALCKFIISRPRIAASWSEGSNLRRTSARPV